MDLIEQLLGLNPSGLGKPLFRDEGPQYYERAFQHNAPFAVPGARETQLSPIEELAFRHWVATNRVPFDPTAPVNDYDMRGYWRAMQQGTAPPWRGPGSDFPDIFKTPYDTTFSAESKSAKPGTPFKWFGNSLIDLRTGQLIFQR
jgi:hypothetical protein